MIPYDLWAEIDLGAIEHNVGALKSCLSRGTGLMAVVKADGYGHGARQSALAALRAGADCLAVARLGEALELRNAGIDCPVLIFGRTRPELIHKLLHYDLIQSVFSRDYALCLSSGARAAGRRLRVHVNVDTGMGRLGVLGVPAAGGSTGVKDAADEIEAVCGLEGLAAEGIYTHFATADERDKTRARRQLELFNKIVEVLGHRGIEFKVRHAANSAAVLDMPEARLDMVRPGISIYGHYPSEGIENRGVQLIPAMSLMSRIVHLKQVGPGFRVGYGWTASTKRKTLIATVAVGYADGFFRLLSSSGSMMVRGCMAPVIGRVCMDHTMIDVGDVPDAACGDTVLVFGRSGEGRIPAELLAGGAGTINYEVLSRISSRVPRIYRRQG